MRKLYYLQISTILFTLISCSSLTSEQIDVVEEFIIGDWAYQEYRQVPSNNGRPQWNDYFNLLTISKIDGKLRYKTEFSHSNNDSEGSIEIGVKKQGIIDRLMGATRTDLIITTIPDEKYNVKPYEYKLDHFGSTRYKYSFEGKDDKEWFKWDTDEKISLMKKQIDFRKEKIQLLKNNKYRLGGNGILANKFSKQTQNSNFSIEYYYDTYLSEYDFNDIILNLDGYYYFVPNLINDKPRIKERKTFSYEELIVMVKVLSKKSNIIETNSLVWKKLSHINPIKDFDSSFIKEIKLDGWNDIEFTKNIEHKGDNYIKFEKFYLNIESLGAEQRRRIGRRWDKHENLTYKNIGVLFDYQFPKSRVIAGTGGGRFKLSDVNLEDESITLVDSNSFYVILK